IVAWCISRSGDALENAARAKLRQEVWILRIVRVLRLLLRVEVIEIAEKHVEAVHRWQELVAVAKMVLAELRGHIALRLERAMVGSLSDNPSFAAGRPTFKSPVRSGD